MDLTCTNLNLAQAPLLFCSWVINLFVFSIVLLLSCMDYTDAAPLFGCCPWTPMIDLRFSTVLTTPAHSEIHRLFFNEKTDILNVEQQSFLVAGILICMCLLILITGTLIVHLACGHGYDLLPTEEWANLILNTKSSVVNDNVFCETQILTELCLDENKQINS